MQLKQLVFATSLLLSTTQAFSYFSRSSEEQQKDSQPSIEVESAPQTQVEDEQPKVEGTGIIGRIFSFFSASPSTEENKELSVDDPKEGEFTGSPRPYIPPTQVDFPVDNSEWSDEEKPRTIIDESIVEKSEEEYSNDDGDEDYSNDEEEHSNDEEESDEGWTDDETEPKVKSQPPSNENEISECTVSEDSDGDSVIEETAVVNNKKEKSEVEDLLTRFEFFSWGDDEDSNSQKGFDQKKITNNF